MQYFGGKSRIAKHLTEVIDRYRQPGQIVWDAFCGGLSMSVALSKNGPVIATDICEPLISLYQAVRNGWQPPNEITRDQHKAAKALPDSDPMKAFAGFGCSFGGMWFHAFRENARVMTVRNGPETGKVKRSWTHAACARGLVKSVPKVWMIERSSFFDKRPSDFDGYSPVLYLDPPYRGCFPYEAVGDFDYERFVQHALQWAARYHVFISEYDFPHGSVVWSKPTRTGFGAKPRLTERLYHLHPGNLK